MILICASSTATPLFINCRIVGLEVRLQLQLLLATWTQVSNDREPASATSAASKVFRASGCATPLIYN